MEYSTRTTSWSTVPSLKNKTGRNVVKYGFSYYRSMPLSLASLYMTSDPGLPFTGQVTWRPVISPQTSPVLEFLWWRCSSLVLVLLFISYADTDSCCCRLYQVGRQPYHFYIVYAHYFVYPVFHKLGYTTISVAGKFMLPFSCWILQG